MEDQHHYAAQEQQERRKREGVGASECSRIWKRRTESQETEKTTDVEFKDLRGST